MHTSIKTFALIFSFSTVFLQVHGHPSPLLTPAGHRRHVDQLPRGSGGGKVEGRRAESDTGLLGGLLGGSEASSSSPGTSAIISSSPSSRIASSAVSSQGVTPSLPATSSSGLSGIVGSLTGNSTGSSSSIIKSSSSVINSTSSTSTTSSAAVTSPTLAPATSIVTDAAGQTSIITLVYTQAVSPASSQNSTDTSTTTQGQSSTISTPAIVGIAVGVGAVILGLIGCAVWRMKRRGGGEDEAIRWPELNRHGDSDAQHALPARQTGQHGFETNPLQRSLSIASSFHSDHHTPTNLSATPMALNGSSFGAASSLEDINEKDHHPSYDDDSIHHASPTHHVLGGDHEHGSTHGYGDEYEGAYAGVGVVGAHDHGYGHGDDGEPEMGYTGGRVASLGIHGQQPGYDFEDYTSFPPVVQTLSNQGGGVGGASGQRYPVTY